jgi:uncharacterized protein (DUF1330 family)
MPKGYWIVHVDIDNAEQFKNYVAANVDPFKKYGARYLVRAGNFEAVEGNCRSRNVIVEFPTYQTAIDCWRSSEYQAAKALRDGACKIDITVIEGYEGQQPNE